MKVNSLLVMLAIIQVISLGNALACHGKETPEDKTGKVEKGTREDLKDKITYFDGFNFTIKGKYHQEKNYQRLPAKFEGKVRPVVWDLSTASSGISVSFRTNSPEIRAKWELLDVFKPRNMTQISANGLDLYCHVNGKWQYVGSGIPRNEIENEAMLISNLDTTYKEFRLHLPLYNGIRDIEIGIAEGYTIEKGNVEYENPKPVVFYGTSITQGASASRPGMAYPSILSRRLNVETINLGFSGNGRFEEAVGQALCEIDAALFVLDCTPNSSPEIIRNNALKLILQIKKCRPDTPILLVESIIRENSFLQVKGTGSIDHIKAQNRALMETFQKAKEVGVEDIYYLKTDGLIGADHEATVDGSHLSDLGMTRIAEKIGGEISGILKLK
jgi:lysophospholipase L1-like esterase